MLARNIISTWGMAALASARALTAPVVCPVVFDGRVPASASLEDFNVADGGGWNPFNPNYVKGQNLQWSDIILLPAGLEHSLFDSVNGSSAPEVTISDLSIFNSQNGFRRAGLQFRKDTNLGSPGSTGQKTLHFSILQDESRSFNLSHEYLVSRLEPLGLSLLADISQNVWHEAADYSSNQFSFGAGTIIGREEWPAETWKLFNRQNELIWSTPIEAGVWQNFAITLDYDEKYDQYSKSMVE